MRTVVTWGYDQYKLIWGWTQRTKRTHQQPLGSCPEVMPSSLTPTVDIKHLFHTINLQCIVDLAKQINVL